MANISEVFISDSLNSFTFSRSEYYLSGSLRICAESSLNLDVQPIFGRSMINIQLKWHSAVSVNYFKLNVKIKGE